MIKGRYVAMVEINFSISDDEPDLLPFEEIRESWRNDTTEAVAQLSANEMYPHGRVKVTQQYADVYRCDE